MILPGPRRPGTALAAALAALAAAALTVGGCSANAGGTLPLPPPATTAAPTSTPAADPWVEYEALAELDRDTLNARQRSLVALGELRAEVNDGGFAQYFAGEAGDHAGAAIDAAVAAGRPALADLVRRALRRLGAEKPPYPGRTTRQDLVAALEQAGTTFDELDEEFYVLEETADLDGAMRRLAAPAG